MLSLNNRLAGGSWLTLAAICGYVVMPGLLCWLGLLLFTDPLPGFFTIAVWSLGRPAGGLGAMPNKSCTDWNKEMMQWVNWLGKVAWLLNLQCNKINQIFHMQVFWKHCVLIIWQNCKFTKLTTHMKILGWFIGGTIQPNQTSRSFANYWAEITLYTILPTLEACRVYLLQHILAQPLSSFCINNHWCPHSFPNFCTLSSCRSQTHDWSKTRDSQSQD